VRVEPGVLRRAAALREGGRVADAARELAEAVRVLVCGDRNWTDEEMIREYLAEIGPSVVIQGEARGADRAARRAAQDLGIPVESYPADWATYGRAAGPIRNRQMLDRGKPTLVVAFHDDIAASKGTANMLKQARDRRIATLIVSHEAEER
jgi:hypothetical protein